MSTNKLRPINQRLLEFVEIRYNGNKSALATDIGISRQRFQKYYNGSLIPVDVVAKIMERHPDLSPYWLIHGRGPMFLGPGTQMKVHK